MAARRTGRTETDDRLRQKAYDAALERADEFTDEEWQHFESLNDRAALQNEIRDLWKAMGNDERAERADSRVKPTVEHMLHMAGLDEDRPPADPRRSRAQ